MTRATAKKRQGRQKHQPQRTCVACRDKTSKRQLVRIVRSPEGPVFVDESGRANGRGAYLCARLSCWEKGIESGSLGFALKTNIHSETVTTLRSYAASHFSESQSDVDRDEGAS